MQCLSVEGGSSTKVFGNNHNNHVQGMVIKMNDLGWGVGDPKVMRASKRKKQRLTMTAEDHE